MANRKYLLSSEGFWYNAKDPSEGCYGIPLEVEEERKKEWEINLILGEEKKRLRVIKAIKLIKETQGRDINYKIYLLKKLGYSHVKIKKGYVELNEITQRDYPNISRFYDRTIQELRDIINNPDKKSTLIGRLDSFQ